MLHAEVTLPGATSSVPSARRFVESLLISWGHPELGWAAALCVSELAGNCALHARTRFTVRVSLEDDVARLEVSDGSFRAPTQRAYSQEATTGRGLRLVDQYASSWGVEMTASGKTVWVVLRAESSAADGSSSDRGSVDLEALLAAFGDDRQPPQAQARSWPVAA